jgi:hypothetical protein
MSELAVPEMEELVIDAWRMTVPRKVWSTYTTGLPDR